MAPPGGLPAARPYNVHRAVAAQDGHSHSEQMLYELLWRSAEAVDAGGNYRVIQIPQSELASAVRMTPKNLRGALERLAGKLSIEEIRTFDRGTRTARTWKIYSYAAILERRRAAGLQWVIRDRGVRFVDPTTMPARPHHVAVDEQHAVASLAPSGAGPARQVRAMENPEATAAFPKGPAAVAGRPSAQTFPLTAKALREAAASCDERSVRRVVSACLNKAPDATDREIAHFMRRQAQRFRQHKQVQDLTVLLLIQVPKCFEGETFRVFRAAERQLRDAERRERARWRREAEAVLDDPASSIDERHWARTTLALL